MIQEAVDRLKAQVPDLEGRVEQTAEFSKIMDKNGQWPAKLTAFVIPLGFQGAPATAVSGAFIQPLRRSIGVVLAMRHHDRTGKRPLDKIDALLESLLKALCGWAPNAETGVFEAVRGNLIEVRAGIVAYQFEFAINDQLRIIP